MTVFVRLLYTYL